MDLKEKYFNKTTLALMDLKQSIDLLEKNCNISINNKQQLNNEIIELKDKMNKKAQELDKIIATLSGVIE